MIGYYFQLALLALRRNVWLTALIVIAVAVGIASSMTAYTLLHTLSGDPIPWKSSRLFVPTMNIIDPGSRAPGDLRFSLVPYVDAVAWTKAHLAQRQAAMFGTSVVVAAEDPTVRPASVPAYVTQSDFFGMFDVPFSIGAPWSHADDESHARVVVLTRRLADRLFPGSNAVGRSVHLDDEPFRVVGVIQDWRPWPSFYDLYTDPPSVIAGGGPELFLPFDTAIEISMKVPGSMHAQAYNCVRIPGPSYAAFVTSPSCSWVQTWVELASAADVSRYRQYLEGFASEQWRSGRLTFKPETELQNVTDWLAYNKVVPDEIRIASLVAFGFLVVCLVNAIALLLARFSRRGTELAVRRALGAPRTALFAQCLIETALIGAAGGLLGLALAWLGVRAERATLPPQLIRAAELDVQLVAMTLGLAVLATVAAGVYPAWRSSRALSALQLKAQ